MNKKINTVKSKASVIFKDNIDTDILIPKNFLKTTKRTGFEDALFFPWRYDESGMEIEDFELNKKDKKDNLILIAGENFGCGSSREHAAWALQDYGFKVVIAGSYSPIFYMNWINNLNLPIVLSREDRIKLIEEVNKGEEVTVDLAEGSVACGDVKFQFDFEEAFREKLLKGEDSIEEILTHLDKIEEYEEKHRL
ncbi:3-isopropylmalate/(R)-2-methylmalate dehydratase small subunit [Anaerosphaera aminiphila DSM 21120]|uniref:3-isopropylmalate dehydratase small subunit n=1 Tax=Anaerosphaera aminiphila DSM 21120 TaxID=1120995 RepID=A0A1M5R7E6_9FIRM|nr:3-isopropylmalate dehydratase small subunit [Anaerosphaera aminiphila]SHH22274.1 3-isopropylmalate/(R)-2-methylmalate dehydratase small subunit [Anaerosphaera aminiphila DSM 21120]